jgi:hypothetical protein
VTKNSGADKLCGKGDVIVKIDEQNIGSLLTFWLYQRIKMIKASTSNL